MFEKLIESMSETISQNQNNPNIDKAIIKYGLSFAIEYGMFIVTSFVIAACFKLELEILVFYITYSFIRTFAGGYHCEKSLTCYCCSIGVILLILMLINLVPSYFYFGLSFFMLLFSIPIIIKLAPVESNHRKLDKDEYKHFRKKTITNLTIECVLIVILAVFKLYNYVFLISLSFFVTGFMLILQIIVAKKQQNQNNI